MGLSRDYRTFRKQVGQERGRPRLYGKREKEGKGGKIAHLVPSCSSIFGHLDLEYANFGGY